MDIYNSNLDDIALTEIRKKQPTIKGFPIWLVTLSDPYLGDVIESEVFFTTKGKDDYLKDIGALVVKVEMKWVKDVREVSFKTND